jgi:predicted outer membrane protein
MYVPHNVWWLAFGAAASLAVAVAQDTGPLGPADREFLSVISREDVLQIEAAHLAAQKASSPQVGRLANTILVAHARMRLALRPIALAHGFAIANTPDDSGMALLARLRAAKGADFDRIYRSQVAQAEQRDLQRFEAAAQSSREDSGVQAFAQAQLPVLREDLRVARGSVVPRG